MMEIKVLVTGAKKRLNMEVLWHRWLVPLLGKLSTKQDYEYCVTKKNPDKSN